MNPNFALQWLDYLGTTIYNKGEQVLKFDGRAHYEINEYGMLNTSVKLGEELGEDEGEEYTTMSYPDLLNMGYIVASECDPSYFWKPRQRCYYLIKRKTRNTLGMTYDSFKKQGSVSGMQIQHDPTHRRLRLVGENVLADNRLRIDSALGPWVVYSEDRPIVTHFKKRSNFTKENARALRRTRMFGGRRGGEEEVCYIPEVPLIISEEKYIVCMPRMDTCQRMIVVGESGKGKSTAVNGMAGRIFYKWQDRVGWLIDPLNQLYDISLPQNYSQFIKTNALINEPPVPIPATQLYLACNYPLHIKNKEISLKATLNFHEFLNKMQFYSYGIKEWELGGARRYLSEIVDELKHITSPKQVKEIMFQHIPNSEKDKTMQAMIYKWVNTFDSIFKQKFTSNLYENDMDATDELTIKLPDGTTKTGHPFIMLMEALTVPVLNISASKRQRWVRNYLADLMQKIVNYQMEMGDKQKRMWIIADELNEIYELGKRKDNASAAFEELYRQGRINNIGFIGNTQSLDKLNPEMYKNATHICCVYMKDNKERKKIGETFNLPKETYNKIESLKQQEMMIFSKDPFVIYDRWGRKKVVTDRKWFKGKILPPVNYHMLRSAGG